MNTARAQTRTLEPINWPSTVYSWTLVTKGVILSHALCGCMKCQIAAGSPCHPSGFPLCGFVPSKDQGGMMGQPLTCKACIAILRDPVARTKHR